MEHLILIVEQYGYIILLPLAIIEGPIITVVAGILVSAQLMNPFIAYAIVVLGDVVGDTVWYGIGRFGRGNILSIAKRFFTLDDAKIEDTRRKLKEHRFRMAVVSKLTQGIGFAGLIAAGIAEMPYLLFITACILVTFGQTAVYMLIGIFFGRAYSAIDAYFHYAPYVFGAVAIAAIMFIFWYNRRHRGSGSK